MAGDSGWKWILTHSILFVTWVSQLAVQDAQCSLATGGDGVDDFPNPPSPSELLTSPPNEWDDDTGLLPEDDEEDYLYAENGAGEPTDENLAEQMGGAGGNAAASSLEAVPNEQAAEVYHSGHDLVQSMIRLLSAQISPSESPRGPNVDLSLLLPLLSQVVTRTGNPVLTTGPADNVKAAEELPIVKKKAPPPPPPVMSSPPVQRTVTVSSSDNTKPEPSSRPVQGTVTVSSSDNTKPESPPRTESPLGAKQKTPATKAATLPRAQKKPAPLPPVRPKRTLDPRGQPQSAGPLELTQARTTGPGQPAGAGEPATAAETGCVRRQALRLNQDHVLNGMAALAKNYAMLGGTHVAQVNVKRRHLPPEGEPGADGEPEAPKDGPEHHLQGEEDNNGEVDFTRSPYNLEMACNPVGTLERKKRGDLKGAAALRSRRHTKAQQTGESTADLEAKHAYSDCRNRLQEQSSKEKSLKGSTGASEKHLRSGLEAVPTIADLQLLARSGSPEQTIQMLQDMLETLKTCLKSNAPATAAEGSEPHSSELESETENASGVQESVGEAGALVDQQLEFVKPKSGLMDTLRRQKNKKRNDKRPARSGGERGVLTYLRRKMSTAGSPKPNVVKRGVEDEESDDDQAADSYEPSEGSPQPTVVDDLTVSGESLPADADDTASDHTAETDATNADEDPGKSLGHHHVYFAFPEDEPQDDNTTTASSAVGEDTDDSAESPRRSPHRTVSRSSVELGDHSELHGAEGCTSEGCAHGGDGHHRSAKRTKGKFFGLFQKWKTGGNTPSLPPHAAQGDLN